MKRFYFTVILFLFVGHSEGQTKELIFGVGPTTSLFYLNGGPVKNLGTVNVNNTTEKRKNLGTSFSLQYNRFNKHDIGYFVSLNYDSYGIPFKYAFERENFVVDIDTKEKYKTIFLNVGIEKKLPLKSWELNFGIGLYTFLYFDQSIDIEPVFNPNGTDPRFKFVVTDRVGNEAGALASIRVMRTLSKNLKIGLHPMYFHTLSAFEPEKVSANLILSLKL